MAMPYQAGELSAPWRSVRSSICFSPRASLLPRLRAICSALAIRRRACSDGTENQECDYVKKQGTPQENRQSCPMSTDVLRPIPVFTARILTVLDEAKRFLFRLL